MSEHVFPYTDLSGFNLDWALKTLKAAAEGADTAAESAKKAAQEADNAASRADNAAKTANDSAGIAGNAGQVALNAAKDALSAKDTALKAASGADQAATAAREAAQLVTDTINDKIPKWVKFVLSADTINFQIYSGLIHAFPKQPIRAKTANLSAPPLSTQFAWNTDFTVYNSDSQGLYIAFSKEITDSLFPTPQQAANYFRTWPSVIWMLEATPKPAPKTKPALKPSTPITTPQYVQPPFITGPVTQD